MKILPGVVKILHFHEWDEPRHKNNTVGFFSLWGFLWGDVISSDRQETCRWCTFYWWTVFSVAKGLWGRMFSCHIFPLVAHLSSCILYIIYIKDYCPLQYSYWNLEKCLVMQSIGPMKTYLQLLQLYYHLLTVNTPASNYGWTQEALQLHFIIITCLKLH